MCNYFKFVVSNILCLLPLYVLTSKKAVVKFLHGISVKHCQYEVPGATDPSLIFVRGLLMELVSFFFFRKESTPLFS